MLGVEGIGRNPACSGQARVLKCNRWLGLFNLHWIRLTKSSMEDYYLKVFEKTNGGLA